MKVVGPMLNQTEKNSENEMGTGIHFCVVCGFRLSVWGLGLRAGGFAPGCQDVRHVDTSFASGALSQGPKDLDQLT